MAKKRTEQIDLNINAITSNALKNIDEVYKKFDTLDGLLDKVTNKGSINGSNISGKDSMRVDKGTEELQRGFKSLEEQLRTLNSTRNDINKGRLQGSGKDVEQLNTTIKEISGVLSRLYSRGGYDGSTVDTSINNRAGKIKEYRLNPDKGIANQGRSTRELEIERLSQKDLRQSASRNYNAPLSKIADKNNQFAGQGYASYREYQSQQAYIGATQARLKGDQTTNEGNIDSLSKRAESLSSQRAKLVKDSDSNPENLTKNNQKIQAIDKEYQSVTKLIVSLERFNDKIKQAQESVDIQKQTLESHVGSGDISVGADPNSIKGQLGKRRLAIGLSAVSEAGRVATQWAQQGATARQSMENETVGLSIAQANATGNVRKGASNDYEKQLTGMGVKNGSNYSGTEVSQLANAYSSSTGDYKDAMKVANNSSQFARFSNVGLPETQQLISNLGNSGAIKNGSDLKGLQTAIESSINNSHMTAKATEQVAGLNNILNSLSGQNLSKSETENITAFQSQMSKYGRNMQGAQGAQAYQGLASIAQNGFNDPVTRMIAGGNDPQYAGLHGQAELNKKMANAGADPEFLMKMVKRADTANQGDKTRTEQWLNTQSGGTISYDQASSLVDMSRDGVTDKKAINKVLKPNKGKGKQAYKDSGVSSLDQAQAQLQKDTVGVSDAFDDLRKATNELKKHMSPLANASATIGGSALTSFGGAVTGGLLTSGLGGKGLAKLGSKVVSTKLGGKIVNSSAGKIATKIIGKGATKTSEKVAVAGVKSGLRTVPKKFVEKTAVKTGEKTLLKGIGKSGLKALPGIGTALSVGWDVKDSFSKDKATANSGKGGLIGSGIGGVIGGIAGSIIPGAGTVAGAVVGSTIGGIAGNFIGGMSNGTGKSKKKVNNTEKRAVATDVESKEDKNIRENKKVIKSYNNMLDKANRTIARAKGGKSNGNGFDISGSVNADSSDSGKDNKNVKSTRSLNGLNRSVAPANGGKNPTLMATKMEVNVNASNIDKTAEEIGYGFANNMQKGVERAHNEFYSKDIV